MSFIDTDDPFSIAAKRIRSSVIRSTPEPQLPIQGKQQPTTYIIEPDLMESQTGKMNLPNDVAFDDAGFAYNTVTGNPVQVVRRPNVLPIAKTPDGFTPVMPKVLDIVGNVMSPLAAGRVPVKAGEVVLGSGAVRTMRNPNKIQIENLINKSEHQELRGLIDDSGVHVWDASKSTHHDTAKELGINYDINNRIHITKPQDEKGFYTLDFDDKWRNPELVKSNPNFVRLLNQDNILVNEPGQGLISGKDFLKLYSDTRPQVAAATGHALEKQNQPFFSALERTVDNAKIGKADANQWIGYLKNQPGVKQEELSWVLNNLPEGQISKEALGDIIKNNKIELKEVVKGGSAGTQEKAFELAKEHGWKSWDDIDEATQRKYIRRAAIEGGASPTKYHNYQLPGGSNYQEMLLTTPVKLSPKTKEGLELTKRMNEGEFNSLNDSERKVLFKKRDDLLREGKIEEGEPYKSSHWDEPNILAHVRYNDRDIPDVGKSLHLEEIQSDWHQAGRKQGYKDPKVEAAINRLKNETYSPEDLETIQNAGVTDTRNYQGVPDAPFKKNWDELAFKRMLHKAANEGYDSVSWTPGEAQAARYDLSKHLDSVGYQKRGENTYNITAWGKNGGSVWSNQSATPEMIEQHLGKEMADKIIKGTGRKEGNHTYLEDLDLKIGGEGMKSFYDKMLVDKANALAKKYGAKVETKNISTQQGKILKRPDGSGFYISYPSGASKTFTTIEEAQSALNGQPVHVLKLTPELRAKAKEGFPLFSSTPITTPVDYDPWSQNKKYKLTPIEGNPFK